MRKRSTPSSARWRAASATESLCAAHRVPVISCGAGTSLEGHANAPFGGVCIAFRDMNHVLAVHASDLDCVIERVLAMDGTCAR